MSHTATYKEIPGGVCAASGFKAAGMHSGIRMNKLKPDLALITSEAPCTAAAVYTQNKVKGAPLILTKEHLQNGKAQAILCNSGNANTCAPGGYDFARDCCALVENATGIPAEDVVIASTGVIGQAMSKEPFENGVPALAAAQSQTGGADAALAIMTTDTKPKEYAVEFTIAGHPCHVGGICKGSGMINPNMATMLAFVTTDAAISAPMLQKALTAEITVSINQISIDGDTSTNDMAVILASGLAHNPEITTEGYEYNEFCAALRQVLVWMSRQLAADGEGATKLLECKVANATDDETARKIAKTVISSDLFKSAMFGADANWGRVLCAIGYTPGDFPVDDISLTLRSSEGEVLVCEHSAHHEFSEDDAAHILFKNEIEVLIDMHTGHGEGMAWGCDLTYDYVKINGDYRT